MTPEPELIVYDDQSFALNWWPHQIYRQQFDELFNHEAYALGEEGEYYHKRYIEGELKRKKFQQQRLEDVFEKAKLYLNLQEEIKKV